jgi:pseudaminic acid biosynthesis-associated methylase
MSQDPWTGEFGASYLERNRRTSDELDKLYQGLYGISRTKMDYAFLGYLPIGMRVLEVGCGDGAQLRLLSQMGFYKLHGMDINKTAICRAKSLSPEIEFLVGDAEYLPYPDCSFDLVFTSGLLIHIPPAHLARVADEMFRCTSRYIWGLEYFASQETEIPYQGQQGMMWARDYSRLWDLRVIRETHYRRLDCDGIDTMYHLERADG